MQVTEIVVRKTHTVSMGNYENVKVEFGATFSLGEEDLPDDVARQAHEFVDAQLVEDLDRASQATELADTYVDTWLNGPSRRSKRTTVRRTR